MADALEEISSDEFVTCSSEDSSDSDQCEPENSGRTLSITTQSLRENVRLRRERQDSDLRTHLDEGRRVRDRSSGAAGGSRCPVPKCPVKTRKMKRHAFREHLPDCMREGSSDFQSQYDALVYLVRQILQGEATVFDLVRYVNTNNIVPRESSLIPIQIRQFTGVSRKFNWRQPTEFSLHPVNSPAVMLHWRIALNLLHNLSSEQREVFFNIGACKEVEACEMSDESVNKEVPMEEATGGSPRIRSVVVKAPTLDAYDSHFHLDRIGRRLKMEMTIPKLMEIPLFPAPSTRVHIIGGTMVFCDPFYFPDVFPVGDGWISAVGFHPRHSREHSPKIKQQLGELMRSDYVSALGEIGLDRTEPSGTWLSQEKTLKDLLELCIVEKPLILHVRGQDCVSGSGDAYSRCLSIVRECVPNAEQPIHLHCFSGLADQVRQWRKDFPNTYFGISGSACHFSEEQDEGLLEVPPHRLLLETDSPYLAVATQTTVNLPQYIGDVAAVIARKCKVAVDQLVKTTNRNFRKLYLN